jgi:hypothetical protein
MPDSPANPSFSRGRRFNAGLNVFVAMIAMLAIVVMVNYVSERHFKRYPLTRNAANQLSTASLLVLKSLTNEVRITILYDPGEDLYSPVASLLREYTLASTRLVLDVVDYRVQPEKAGRIKVEHHLSDEAKNLVIFSCNGKSKTVSQAELSEYDFSQLMSGTGKEIKRKAFHGERLFTSAILTVADPTPARVYFLTGHGEHDPRGSSNQRDYGKFATLLREGSMVLAGLSLNGTNEVPADCQLLVLGGPISRVDPEEQEKLDRYLNQGGRMLVLVPHRSASGLEPLLAKWGVELGDDQVVDKDNSQGDQWLYTLNYASHPVVRALAQASLPVLLVAPRSVGKKAAGAQSADAPQVTELATTGEGGMAVKDHRNGLRRNPLRDRQGVIPLMAAVERGSLKGVNLDRGATRLVVVGDSDFLDNELIDNRGNREYAWQAVSWLLDRSQLLGGISSRSFEEFRVNVPPGRMQRLRWALVGGIPGGVLLVGFLVWLRRRY